MHNFVPQIHCIVLGSDLPNNGKYILSVDSNNITFPSFYIEPEHFTNNDIDMEIIKFIKQHICVNEISLLPQIINIHHNRTSILDVIYGFIVKYTQNINNCYWIPLDLSEDSLQNNIIYEVIQKLQ